MTKFRVTEHVDAPIDKVFDLAIEFQRYPEWNVNYLEVKELTDRPPKVGTKIHAVMKFLGRRVEGEGEVLELVRPTLLKSRGSSSPDSYMTYTVRFTKAPVGTDVEIECEYTLPAGIFGDIADKVFVERTVERDMRHSMENFKDLVKVQEPALA